MKCYRETLKIERLAGDQEDVLLTLQYISQVHHQRGDLLEALKCYAEILSIQRTSRPDDHETIARTLSRMANVHLQNGNAAMVVETMTEAYRRMLIAGRSGEELPLSGFHLYGFAKVHPESAAAA
jgi:tetratricopeptide (TPR) repeat protein